MSAKGMSRLLGLGVIFLPMATTSWIGILGNFDLTVCAGVFTGLSVLCLLSASIGLIKFYYGNKLNQSNSNRAENRTRGDEYIEIGPMLFSIAIILFPVSIVPGIASGITGLVFAYEQIATLNSALPIMSAASLKTSIFGNILYAATKSAIGGSESAIMASIAHSPLMMGLTPNVAFGIWDGIFFPLAGILILAVGRRIVDKLCMPTQESTTGTPIPVETETDSDADLDTNLDRDSNTAQNKAEAQIQNTIHNFRTQKGGGPH